MAEAVALVVTVATLSGCYEATEGGDYPVPHIINVTEARLRVGETLVVELLLVDPLDEPEWTYTSETIPDLEHHSTIDVNREPVRFRYTPVASHVGHHQLTFTVSAHDLSDSMTMDVTVLSE